MRADFKLPGGPTQADDSPRVKVGTLTCKESSGWGLILGSSRHVRCVNRLNMLLAPRLVGQAIVQVQSSLKLEVHWEPQPDIAVLRLREDDYVSGLPTGADVLLLIEVVDSSREYDRAKLPAYARSGIPEVWLVDLQDQVLLSHRQPVGAEYRMLQALRIGDSVSPQALLEHTFSVDSILG